MLAQDLRLLLRYRPLSCIHHHNPINQSRRSYQTAEVRKPHSASPPHTRTNDRPTNHPRTNNPTSSQSESSNQSRPASHKTAGKRQDNKEQRHARHQARDHDPTSKYRNYERKSAGVDASQSKSSVAEIAASDKYMLHAWLMRYVRSGAINKALSYFRFNQSIADSLSWRVMLTALIDDQQHAEVHELWKTWLSIIPPDNATNQIQQMKADDLLPTADVMAALLRCHPSPVTYEQALEFLDKWGLSSNTFLHNSIVKETIRKNDFMKAGFFLRDMQIRNIPPDSFTIGLHLSLLKQRERGSGGKHRSSSISIKSQLWDRCMQHRLELNASLLIPFMACFKENTDDVRTAQLVDYLIQFKLRFDALHIYYHMLTVLMKRDRIDSILKLYEYLQSTGFPIDVLMFGIMITAFHRQRDIKSIKMLYDEMVSAGVQPNAKIFNVLLRTHAMFGDTKAMNEVFERMATLNIEPDSQTFDDIQRGICEWYWEIHSAQARRSGSLRMEKDIRAEYELTPRDLFATNKTELVMDEAVYSIQLQPLSAYLLPWMHLMNERGVTKSERIYNRTLLALRRDQDISSMLYYLNEMVENGLPHNEMALSAVMQQLAATDAYHAPERLAATQLMFLCDKLVDQDVRLEPETWEQLLTISVKAKNFLDARQCYHKMITAKCVPSEQAYRSLMSLCMTCEADEQQRMKFVISCYDDMRDSNLKMVVAHFNFCLNAHAVLGNTDGMKEVLGDMAELDIAPEQSTMEVLEQARQHVAYTAEMYNWILQQQNLASIDQRSSSSINQSATASAPNHNLSDVDPLSLDTSALENIFSLPSWSPLVDAAPITPAIQILQKTMPIYQSAVFPALKTALELRRASEAVSVPAEELAVIKQELVSLKGFWPAETSMSNASVIETVKSSPSQTQLTTSQAFARLYSQPITAAAPVQLTAIDSIQALEEDDQIEQSVKAGMWPLGLKNDQSVIPVPAEPSTERSYTSSRLQRLSTGALIGRPAYSFGAHAPREPLTHYTHSRSRTQRLHNGLLIGRAPESFGARFNIRYKKRRPTASIDVQSSIRSSPIVAPSTPLVRVALAGRVGDARLVDQHQHTIHRKPAVRSSGSSSSKHPRRSGAVGLRSLRPDVKGFNGGWLKESKE